MNAADKKLATILVVLTIVVLAGGWMWVKSILPAAQQSVEAPVASSLNAASMADRTVKASNATEAANQGAQTALNGGPARSAGVTPSAATGPSAVVASSASATGKPSPTVAAPTENPFKKVLPGDISAQPGESSMSFAQRVAEENRVRNSTRASGGGLQPPVGALPAATSIAPFSPTEASSAFRLLGIVSDPAGHMAVVNYGGTVLHLKRGQKLANGLRIVRITDDTITLSAKKFSQTVEVGGTLGATPAAKG